MFDGSRPVVQSAASPPPRGAVDFAAITIEIINTGLSDAEYEAIRLTYALLLEGTGAVAPSFVRGVDVDGNPVMFGPGTANGIDVNMMASGNADAPEPSAALAALVGAFGLIGAHRP